MVYVTNTILSYLINPEVKCVYSVFTSITAPVLVCVPAADREDGQNVARAAVRPAPVAEERPAGMPRRRRNLHSRVNAQRAQRLSDNGRHAEQLVIFVVKLILGSYVVHSLRAKPVFIHALISFDQFSFFFQTGVKKKHI